MTKTKSPGALAARGASEIDGIEHHVVSKLNCQQTIAQAPIRAALIGSDRCEAEGISAHRYAPALELCRKLVATGFNPACPLEAWRGQILCLRVRSIGEGARFSVEEDRHDTPHLRRWRDPQRHGGGSPIVQVADGQGVRSPAQPASGEAAP